MRFDQMLGFRYSPGAKGRMANQLKMALVQDILTLRRHGWSGRRIARELGVCRETVGRYVNGAGPPKPASNAPTGAPCSEPASNAPLGSTTLVAGGSEDSTCKADVSKPASNAP